MKKITVGILAHVDAGKTTLAEAMLYSAGAIRKCGRVDEKTSTLDSHELEKERGITVFAGEATFVTGGTEFTLIDTPGHIDFSAETERVISVLDCAVLVISETGGVEAYTRTVWRLLSSYGIPVFIFVTKCDMNRRSKEEIIAELEKEFGMVAEISDYEKIALCDEDLLDEYIKTGKIGENGMTEAIKKRKVFPCFFGSGLKNIGVGELSDAISKYVFPDSYGEKFGAKVYKISHDKTERLTKLRVTGGTLRVKDKIEYSGISEKINEIRIYTGKKYVCAESVESGTVCAVTGLSATYSGQGLGTEKDTAQSLIEPVISYKILLPDKCDRNAVLKGFKILCEEDPKLNITYNERLGEFRCSLMGTVQTEIFKSTVKERLGLDVDICDGSVIYKETVEAAVEGVGHYEPLRHYAEVHLIIEPLPRGSGLKFDSVCREDTLERSFRRLVLTHLAEKTHLGVLTGSPVTDMKISLASGKAHEKHTEGGDFREATYRAVRQGLMKAKSVLLEPYYYFRLSLPSEFSGRAETDIHLMGGNVLSRENNGENALLCGKAPVVTLDGYMAEVISYTRGLGNLSLEFAGYDLCHNPDEVIKKAGYNPESDLENTPDSVFCDHGAGFTVKWYETDKYMHLEKVLK